MNQERGGDAIDRDRDDERERGETHRIDLYVHGLSGDAEVARKLDLILNAVGGLVAQGKVTLKQLDDLTAEVAENTKVEESAKTLIEGLAEQIKAAGTDPAKLQALTDSLTASKADLAAAITANTPAAPPTGGSGGSTGASGSSGSGL